MAIVNITEDSFSDGGLYFELPSALNHAKSCVKEGAHILDIGAQSTRPGASEVGADIEKKRLIPLIKELKLLHPDIPISVDTFHHSVADNVLNSGANWINDISGGRHDPEILNVIADKGCPYVMTHSRGNSKTMDSLANYTKDFGIMATTSNIINPIGSRIDYFLSDRMMKGVYTNWYLGM